MTAFRWYVERNLPTLMKDEPTAAFPPTQSFYPYLVTFSINGFAHGSMPLQALTLQKGQRVRWYVFAGTNDFDAHTQHWHGNVVTINQMRTDVGWVAPMQMLTADMAPDNVGPGSFTVTCHSTTWRA